jgi:hypothetical protein
MKTENNNHKTDIPDGIYLIKKDGKKILFTGVEKESDIEYVGLKLGSKAICVALQDATAEEVSLTTRADHADYADYKNNYLDATADWDGAKNTGHLKLIGLNPKIHLKDGEYIPSVGELKFIQLFRKQINEALKAVGGEPITGDWYWTSTEHSSSYAWFLRLNSGALGSWPAKAAGSGHVRAVKAF